MSQSRFAPELATETVDGIESPLDEPVRPSGFSALRHRNFRLYAVGMLVSMAGTWMQSIAQGWLVYDMTKSEQALGLVAFAAAIPALIISPWAGVILDRTSKRAVLYLTQSTAMVLALTLSYLTYSNRVQVWQILAMSVVLGVVNAFDGPARQAFVVEMVGREDLPNAIAINSLIFNGARVVGPALGGLLLAAVGAAMCFLLNGLSFLAVIVALAAMQLAPFVRNISVNSPWSDLKAGLVYVRKQPLIQMLLIQALIFCVFGTAYSAVLPAYVDVLLGVGAGMYGVLMAFIGMGAVTSGYILARYSERVPRGKILMIGAFAFPFILGLFAFTTNVYVALLLGYLLGVGFITQFVLLNTLLQTRVENEMRGRVLSLYTLILFGFGPFGSLALGWLAEIWGLSITIAVSAACTLVLTALNLLRHTDLRYVR